MLAFWLGLLGPIVALVGWFGFHSLPALLIGTLCYVAEVLLECRRNGFSDRALTLSFLSSAASPAALSRMCRGTSAVLWQAISTIFT